MQHFLVHIVTVCEGPLKVVYMSSNYSHGLAYQCLNVSPRNGACARSLVYVIAKSRDASQSAFDDVMQHVDQNTCLRPFDLRPVSHEGLLIPLISRSSPSTFISTPKDIRTAGKFV